MAGPTNAVVGDLDEPTQLPVTEVDEQVLDEERKLARYSKTSEFKRLREFMEARIKFYQRFLPDGREIKDVVPDPAEWKAANIVVREFQNILDEYDRAREVVKDHDSNS